MKKYIIFLVMVLLVKLNAQTESETITVGHLYSISVPKMLMRTYDLAEGNSLQYQNKAKELYLIVVDESKEQLKALDLVCNSVDDYYELITSNFNKDYKNFKLIAKNNYQAGEQKIVQTEFTYSLEDNGTDIEIYVCQDYVETKDYFYKVVSWTLPANIEKYGNLMRGISKSIREK